MKTLISITNSWRGGVKVIYHWHFNDIYCMTFTPSHHWIFNSLRRFLTGEGEHWEQRLLSPLSLRFLTVDTGNNEYYPPCHCVFWQCTLGTTTFIPLVTAFSDSVHRDNDFYAPPLRLRAAFSNPCPGLTTLPLTPPPPQIRYHWNKKVVTNGRSILMQCMFLLFMLCGR